MSAAAHPMSEEPTPLGQDPTSEELAETPRRVAASYAELLTSAPFTLTSFPNDEGYDELVLARAIPFSSLCQHHLLPFTGVAHVGYLPTGRILGLSKLARTVTSALHGRLRDDPRSRQEFLAPHPHRHLNHPPHHQEFP